MSKVVQALLSGIFFTFLLDFFLFLGIYENYIRAQDIDLYYNILFADNQSLLLFVIFTIILGYITIYVNTKFALITIGMLSLLTLLTLVHPIGYSLGKAILMSENVKIDMQKFSYQGDILYRGRDSLVFYDYKLEKNLDLDKNKIIGEY